jgi:hypothetical protein
MFIGHFAVALAAKRVTPATSLGVLFAAAQFADLLWSALLFAGVERAEVELTPGTVIPLQFVLYPYSHSLLAVIWSGHAMWLLIAWAWWVDGHRVLP